MQFGVWLTTLQSAFKPQLPGQGSLHFWLIHARCNAHSLLLIHSGRQFGGVPVNSGKHEHDGASPIALHWALGPHGFGWQGFVGSGLGSSPKTFLKINKPNRCELEN